MIISNSEKDANGVDDASQVYCNSTAYEPNYTEIVDIPVKRQDDIEMHVKPSEAEYTNVHGYNKPVYNEPVDFEIKSRKGKFSCERTGLALLTLFAVGIGVALAMSIFGYIPCEGPKCEAENLRKDLAETNEKLAMIIKDVHQLKAENLRKDLAETNGKLAMIIKDVHQLKGRGKCVEDSKSGFQGNGTTCKGITDASHRSYFNNYFDEIAMSSCTALSATHGHAGHIAAVRRTCGSGPSCDEVCKGAGTTPNYKGPWKCFETLHVYKRVANELRDNYDSYVDSGKVGLYVYRYNGSCGSRYCGPNYCCCVGK